MKSIYIAGPMRGIKGFNFDAFFRAQALLESWLAFVTEDWAIINPAQHDMNSGFNGLLYDGTEDLSELGFDLEAAMTWDLQQVRNASAIYLLKGWENSAGTARELAQADELGIPVFKEGAYTDEDALWDLLTHRGDPKPAKGNEGEVYNRFTGETRSVSASGGEKGVKLARYDLIPSDALKQIAEHYGVGANKYADNQWRKGYEWSKSFAALVRHAEQFWGGEDFDEETGSNHMAAVAWHALTLLTFYKDCPQYDDRYKE